jgi:hypothetical protein
MNLEQWGLFGIFLAGAIPWMEAIAVVPSGIVLGLNPYASATYCKGQVERVTKIREGSEGL